MRFFSHKIKEMRFLTLIAVLAASTLSVFGQENFDDVTDEQLFEMSLEDIMNLKIVSASKRAESVFESPLSATVITRKEIFMTGATSIPEALRLSQGLIVREQTNGSYDLHLRGMDNVPSNGLFTDTQNLISLVMIDGRIVYNYLNGGTFWEAMPIDLNDVERIEVIRGPSSALYGPNAVGGVINIITRRQEESGVYLVSNIHGGNMGTRIGNASVGYLKDKWAIMVSGNYQKRDRYEDHYYILSEGDYVDLPDSVLSLVSGQPRTDLFERYPDQSLSMDRYGFNGQVTYQSSDSRNVTLSAGKQSSVAQTVFSDFGITPLTTNEVSSDYINIDAIYDGFNVRASRTSGTQNQTASEPIPYTLLAGSIEYHKEFGNLTLRPGISYNSAEYGWDDIIKGDVYNVSASLRGDLTMGNFRAIAALRSDQYSAPDDNYLSYQFGLNYNLNDQHLFRVVHSRANIAPFIFDLYADITVSVPAFTGVNSLAVEANEQIDLTNMDTYELGYRGKISDKLFIDLELFRSNVKNYTELQYDRTEVRFVEGLLFGNLNFDVFQVKNLPLNATQYGFTPTVTYRPVKGLTIKGFGTVQKTQLRDFAPDVDDQSVLEDKEHLNTPRFYGGGYVNWEVGKFNLNLNAYYFSGYTLDHQDYEVFLPFPTPQVLDFQIEDKVPSSMILNAKASFQITDHLNVYVNARNLGASERQFAFTDRISSVYLMGLNLDLNR